MNDCECKFNRYSTNLDYYNKMKDELAAIPKSKQEIDFGVFEL